MKHNHLQKKVNVTKWNFCSKKYTNSYFCLNYQIFGILKKKNISQDLEFNLWNIGFYNSFRNDWNVIGYLVVVVLA